MKFKTHQTVILALVGLGKAAEAPRDYSFNAFQSANDKSNDPATIMRDTPQETYQVVTSIFDTGAVTLTGLSGNTGTSVAGDSCVKCIRSASMTGIWCSASWNYEYPTGETYPVKATTTGTDRGNIGGGFDKDSNDMGSCCYSINNIKLWLNSSTNTDSNLATALNKWTCPAKFDTDASQVNTSTNSNADITTKSVTPWWCSDGTFNMVSEGLYGTNGAIEESFGQVGYVGSSYQDNIINVATDDRRMDLFVAQCRQRADICGASLVNWAPGDTAQQTRAIVHGSFNKDEKCTYIARSAVGAPTFGLVNTSGSAGIDEGYDVHYQEWVEGWELTKNTDFVEQITRSQSTGTSSGTPFAHMTSTKYAKAFKYNYSDTQAHGMQEYGEAYTYLLEDQISFGGTDLSSKSFDNRVKRWFPATSGIEAVRQAQTDFTAFTAASANYAAEATVYNKYIKTLQAANGIDGLTLFLNPPEIPKLVVRPNAPPKPAAYKGLREWDFAKSQLVSEDKVQQESVLNTPSATEFLPANNKGGGWGAWTMQRYVGTGTAKGQDTNYPQHSFGMLGVQPKGTDDAQLGLSVAKTWGVNIRNPDWTDELLPSFSNILCQTADLTTAAWPCYLTGSSYTKSVKNTSNVYVAITVWANDKSAAAFSSSSLTIQFDLKPWSNMLQGPLAPGDLSPALSTPTYAKSLIAAAGAIVTIGASLY